MLWLQQLKISNFKNYPQLTVTLHPQVNCFVGKNGSGKTNLLDAIYCLSFTKSFFNAIEQHNIKHDQQVMFLEGNYERNTLLESVSIAVQRGEKKIFKVNNNEVKKLADHIGQYPLVMITPNDIMLIHEGSEERRKFLDGMIAQTDKSYLQHLLAYNRTLEQRNRQLKRFAEQNILDITLLESYNEQLIKYGNQIHQQRKTFLENFTPVFFKYYQLISSSRETVGINFQSDLNETTFDQLLNEVEPRDIAAQRTTKGIHKDELEFIIDGLPLKKFGSQGQQKSFIIALKLAQYDYLKERTGTKPLLLLDDVFEKLDGERLQKLLSMIAADAFGQIFITDTHLDRLKEIFNEMPATPVKYFKVEEGNIHEI